MKARYCQGYFIKLGKSLRYKCYQPRTDILTVMVSGYKIFETQGKQSKQSVNGSVYRSGIMGQWSFVSVRDY